MHDSNHAEKYSRRPGWVLLGCGIIALALGIAAAPGFIAAHIIPRGTLTHETLPKLAALRVVLLASGFILTVCSSLFLRDPKWFLESLKERARLQTDFLASRGKLEKAFGLFLVSFLGLYFEILVIRWLSTELRIFAYFTNFPLMSCFLGLGIGFALASRRQHLYLAFPALFSLFSALVVVATIAVPLISYPGSSEEYIWGMSQTQWLQSMVFYGIVLFFFFLNVLCFIPLGHLTGYMLTFFSPLKAYSINIAGSLLGVWVFSAISFFRLSPIFWFAFGLILFLWLVRGEKLFFWMTATLFAAFILFLASFQQTAHWSCYYRIDVRRVSTLIEQERVHFGYTLSVNQDYHQNIMDLSTSFLERYGERFPVLKSASFAYNVPYELFPAEDVLIVGAGTGNDVAAALRNGVSRIEAVEIDPVILDLGRELHPEHPYSSKRVRLINDDARSYFQRTDKKYDIIVYGLLDSHALFSNMSNLRLDNYVYTLESFREASRHLTDNGVIALTFGVHKDWISARLYNMLREVFREKPLSFTTGYDNGIMFIAGPGLKGLQGNPSEASARVFSEQVVPNMVPAPEVQTAMTTDNWPYLYLKDKKIPGVYWKILAVTLGLSLVLILRIFPESRKVSPPFFFLGSAFLLIEFKSITDMALLFGSTWLVNSFVISCILLMILIANYVTSRFEPKGLTIIYVLLGLSLLLNYLIPVSSFLKQPLLVRGMLGASFLSLPIFFAGIIFATLLKRFPRIEIAFGSNLLGAVIGGLLEYSSLIYGLRNLLILSALLYALSYLALRRNADLRLGR